MGAMDVALRFWNAAWDCAYCGAKTSYLKSIFGNECTHIHPLLPVHENGKNIHPCCQNPTWRGCVKSDHVKHRRDIEISVPIFVVQNLTHDIIESRIIDKNEVLNPSTKDLDEIKSTITIKSRD